MGSYGFVRSPLGVPHGVGEGAVHEQAEAQHVDAVRQEGDALREGTCSVKW